MKSKIKFLVMLLGLFLTATCFADEGHVLKFDRGKFYFDDKYCFTIGDGRDEIIKSLGNSQSIENYTVDDYTAGYAYSYKGDSVCIELNHDNKIRNFLINEPFLSEDIYVKKIIIDGLDFDRDLTLSSIIEELKEKNIKYELEQNGVVWPVYKLSVCSELNGEIRNYHLMFRTDFGTEYLYDILYYAPGY